MLSSALPWSGDIVSFSSPRPDVQNSCNPMTPHWPLYMFGAMQGESHVHHRDKHVTSTWTSETDFMHAIITLPWLALLTVFGHIASPSPHGCVEVTTHSVHGGKHTCDPRFAHKLWQEIHDSGMSANMQVCTDLVRMSTRCETGSADVSNKGQNRDPKQRQKWRRKNDAPICHPLSVTNWCVVFLAPKKEPFWGQDNRQPIHGQVDRYSTGFLRPNVKVTHIHIRVRCGLEPLDQAVWKRYHHHVPLDHQSCDY